jgi:hypothetical protein
MVCLQAYRKSLKMVSAYKTQFDVQLLRGFWFRRTYGIAKAMP